MTKEQIRNHQAFRAIGNTVISISVLIVTAIFGIYMSGESAEFVKEGMIRAIKSVVPSSFTFMIISDVYIHYGKPENIPLLKSCFCKVFNLPPSALSAFICGNVGGFPIGAKMTADLYREGRIDKLSAERLTALSCNPSCAFIMGGVGLGMFNSSQMGFILLISVYISALICGYLFKGSTNKFNFTEHSTRQNFIFVDSVKSAGINSISIISFISFFSVVLGFIKKYIKKEGIIYLLASFLEVTNACELFADISSSYAAFSAIACAFSLAFGGVCVMLQTGVFTSHEHLSMRSYFIIKLVQGLLSALICAFIMTVFLHYKL